MWRGASDERRRSSPCRRSRRACWCAAIRRGRSRPSPRRSGNGGRCRLTRWRRRKRAPSRSSPGPAGASMRPPPTAHASTGAACSPGRRPAGFSMTWHPGRAADPHTDRRAQLRSGGRRDARAPGPSRLGSAGHGRHSRPATSYNGGWDTVFVRRTSAGISHAPPRLAPSSLSAAMRPLDFRIRSVYRIRNHGTDPGSDMRHLALERSLTDRTYDAILDAICGGRAARPARASTRTSWRPG